MFTAAAAPTENLMPEHHATVGSTATFRCLVTIELSYWMLYHNDDPVQILAIEADAIDNEEHRVTLRDISETHRAYQLVILHVDQDMHGDKLCCSHQGEKVCSILRIQGK